MAEIQVCPSPGCKMCPLFRLVAESHISSYLTPFHSSIYSVGRSGKFLQQEHIRVSPLDTGGVGQNRDNPI